jgi:hypothetical protein
MGWIMTTSNTYEIGYTWVDLNTLTGIDVGTKFIIQNCGFPQDVIIAVESDTEPTAGDYDAVYIRQLDPMYKATKGSGRVWVKLYRYDRNDQSRNRTAPLRIQY